MALHVFRLYSVRFLGLLRFSVGDCFGFRARFAVV